MQSAHWVTLPPTVVVALLVFNGRFCIVNSPHRARFRGVLAAYASVVASAFYWTLTYPNNGTYDPFETLFGAFRTLSAGLIPSLLIIAIAALVFARIRRVEFSWLAYVGATVFAVFHVGTVYACLLVH